MQFEGNKFRDSLVWKLKHSTGLGICDYIKFSLISVYLISVQEFFSLFQMLYFYGNI